MTSLTEIVLTSLIFHVSVMAELDNNSWCQEEGHGGTNDGTGESTVTVPRELLASRGQKKKLVLHVDLNNTILVSDAVTGQGTVAALDCFLASVTWGKMSKHGKLHTRGSSGL